MSFVLQLTRKTGQGALSLNLEGFDMHDEWGQLIPFPITGEEYQAMLMDESGEGIRRYHQRWREWEIAEFCRTHDVSHFDIVGVAEHLEKPRHWETLYELLTKMHPDYNQYFPRSSHAMLARSVVWQAEQNQKSRRVTVPKEVSDRLIREVFHEWLWRSAKGQALPWTES
jgi:hypothetical protein